MAVGAVELLLTNELLLLMVFAAWVCACGAIMGRIHPSCRLVGDMAAGALLGPQGMDIVPYPYVLSLYGRLGVVMLVANGGIAADVATLGASGGRMIAGSLTGVILPLLATGAFLLLLNECWQSAVVGGAVLASTSAAVALAILEGRMHSRLAQLVAGSAMLDDVCALVLLALVSALANEQSSWGALMLPVVTSALLIALGLCLWRLLPTVMQLEGFIGIERIRRLSLGVLLVSVTIGAVFAPLCGSSELLGAFCAGLAFSGLPFIEHEWVTSVGSLQSVLERIFFASIGFQLPLATLADPWVLLWGVVLTVLASITKLAVGVWGLPDRPLAMAWGAAMVIRPIGVIALFCCSNSCRWRGGSWEW